MSCIICKNVHKTYGHGKNSTHAVRGISATFESGQFYSIIGRSGSGKSTFLHILGGILAPDEGTVLYDSCNLGELNDVERAKVRLKQTGFVFQDYQLLPELTVKENILVPAILDHRILDEDWCNKIMAQLEITSMADRYPSEEGRY
ncbi:MAG: ATP-binding cassette domain-containing protein [Lachnospiraceae bacterium]|nr:ATP-binding cassette domain-containing protein [Lachnospiraceae bacterium]